MNPDYQLLKFCHLYSTKKVEVFPAVDYTLYTDPTFDVYQHVDPNCDIILFDSTFLTNNVEQCYGWIKSLKLKHYEIK